MRIFPAFAALALTACATSTVNEPSLARRPAEAIDPRLPIPPNPTLGPVDATLAARLGVLIRDGKAGAAEFDRELGNAQRSVQAAGAAQSESWILAQQALSALEAAQAGTTRALADIDELTAGKIQGSGGLTAADLAAVEAASAELRMIGERQAQAMTSLAARLDR